MKHVQQMWGAIVVLTALLAGLAKADEDRGLKFKSNPIVMKAVAGQPFLVNLNTFLLDADASKTSFFVGSDMPKWLKLNPDDGFLMGAPGLSDVGKSTFRLEAQAEDTGAITMVQMEVTGEGLLIQDPVNLPMAQENRVYKADLRRFVFAPSGDRLVFAKLSGPAWISVTADGVMTGTPKRQDVGTYQFIFRVSNSEGLVASATAVGLVQHVSQPPIWMQDPIVLRAVVKQPFTIDLKSFVKDLDGNPLTFQLVEPGPGIPENDWATLDKSGILQGVPSMVGAFQETVRVSNGEITADARLLITVIDNANKAPYWIEDPIHLPDACVGKPYHVDMAALYSYAEDPDGDVLRISVKVFGWLKAGIKGIAGTPMKDDMGTHNYTAILMDGQHTTAASVVVVVKDCH